MLRFVVRRMILVLPGLLMLVSLLFVLTKFVPGDPVLDALHERGDLFEEADLVISHERYRLKSEQLGLDKPYFYCSLVPATYSRELYDLPLRQQQFAWDLLRQNAAWVESAALLDHLAFMRQLEDINLQGKSKRSLATLGDLPSDLNILNKHAGMLSADPDLPAATKQVAVEIASLSDAIIDREDSVWLRYVPKLIWHGLDNQYHHWLTAAFSLDFGTSLVDGQQAWTKIARALKWTLLLNLISLSIAYGVGILLGTYAGWKGGWRDQSIQVIMYIFYAIPIFWLTTILVVFFSTSEYGAWTNIFPATGIWETSGTMSFWTMIMKNVTQLIIPVMVLSLHLIAYVGRQMKSSVVGELRKSYVWHARAFGMDERRILWKQVFRNASSPLITMLGTLLPAAIGGSLVVEYICNVPGMGRLMYDAISAKDWSVVIGIVLISGVLTMLGTLISDLLYRWVNPRVEL